MILDEILIRVLRIVAAAKGDFIVATIPSPNSPSYPPLPPSTLMISKQLPAALRGRGKWGRLWLEYS